MRNILGLNGLFLLPMLWVFPGWAPHRLPPGCDVVSGEHRRRQRKHGLFSLGGGDLFDVALIALTVAIFFYYFYFLLLPHGLPWHFACFLQGSGWTSE